MPNTSIFTNVINYYLPEPHASLLNGILFGINLKVSREFYQQMRTVGLLHLVVLSGMNIVLMSSIVAQFTSGFSKRVSSLIMILIVILFILFVHPQAPIVRAGIMSISTFASIIYGRKNFVIYTFILSGFLIWIFWPSWIKSISFQLSYGATLGIILFGQSNKIEDKSSLMNKIIHTLWSEIKPSLAAQVFTAPIIFIYFRQISLIAPLSNLMVSPLVAPLMFFGFLTSILGKINWALGIVPSYICFGLLSYMIKIISILAKVPYALLSF